MVNRVQSNARPRLGACAAPLFGLAGSEVVGGILGYRAEKCVRRMFFARILSVHEQVVLEENVEDVLKPDLHGLAEGAVRFLASHLFLVIGEGRLVDEEGGVTASLNEALGRHAVRRESNGRFSRSGEWTEATNAMLQPSQCSITAP